MHGLTAVTRWSVGAGWSPGEDGIGGMQGLKHGDGS